MMADDLTEYFLKYLIFIFILIIAFFQENLQKTLQISNNFCNL